MEQLTKSEFIEGKEWFDKINGNSYCSARVTLNYGMKDELSFRLPYEYGYGSQYQQTAFEELVKRGYFEKSPNTRSLRESGIILRSNLKENCLKRDVKYWGEE